MGRACVACVKLTPLGRGQPTQAVTLPPLRPLTHLHRAHHAHRDATIAQMTTAHTQVVSSLQSSLTSVSSASARVLNENSALRSMLIDVSNKSTELTAHCDRLQEQVTTLTKQVADSSQFLNHELEAAYERMHGKMERQWHQRVQVGERLWIKEHQVEQLLAFILSEGLQLPHLPPAPAPPAYGLMEE